MPDMNEPQNTLRDTLTANFDALESGTLDHPSTADEPITFDATTGERVRDDKGRFAPKDADLAAAPSLTPEAKPAQELAPTQLEAAPELTLTTWKKEYRPLHEKLAQGLPLTAEEAKKLAEYNVQREKEYSTGISTYKGEAQNAKQLQSAMNEFMPILQQHRIDPAQWIQNLGRAHQTLAMGSPEQKLAMFARLAQDYGVPLPAVTAAQQGQLDPTVTALMAEINNLKQGVNTVTSWHQEQQQADLHGLVAKFEDAEKYPHYTQVRETMAQILESGLAQNLDDAYDKAVYLNPETRQAEQARQATANVAQQQASKAAAVAKAKASAGSVRSATPSGAVTTAMPKDRRAILEQGFDSLASGRV